MRQKPRVLYLQLPVLDYSYDYRGADLPLSGATLAAYALDCGVEHEAVFLPPEVTSFASDPAIVQRIRSLRPDLVAATLQLWNVERTIGIVRALKTGFPKLLAFAGGPEAAPGFARRNPCHPFDWVCAGEGEAAFREALSKAKAGALGGKTIRVRMPRKCRLVHPDRIPSPYLEGQIGLAPDRSLLLETMRGCPFGCAYCYYGKMTRGVRPHSRNWILRHFAWANQAGAREIYFLDPSFQIARNLHERLALIATWNRSRIPLHTEARVEKIDESLAKAFARAGFVSLEVGLQSIHPEVLRAVHRRGDAKAFARGARLLKERGIRLVVDIIAGLPKDTPEGFQKTVDFLVEEGFSDETSVFPLLLLPGTTLRANARRFKMVHQRRPPYQVESSPSFSREALRETLDQAGKKLNTDIFPLHLPDFTPEESGEGLIGFLEIDAHRTRPAGLKPAELPRLAQCPVFLFHLPETIPWDLLDAWAAWQHKTIPTLLPFFGIAAESPFSIPKLIEFLNKLHLADSYAARLWSLAPDPYLRLSCRPFVLSLGTGDPSFWLQVHRYLPVIRRLTSPEEIRPTHPLHPLFHLLDTRVELESSGLHALRDCFRDREEDLLFSNRKNAGAWARLVGLPPPLPEGAVVRTRIPTGKGESRVFRA
jgi:radical SAM superfamily enzyme YgiQ (UPF0313 family)